MVTSRTTKIGAVIIFCILVGLASAAVIDSYVYPQTVTITNTLAMYIDDAPYSNNTLIDWGTLSPDMTVQKDNLTVVNVGSQSVTVYWMVVNLPNGWTQTWTGNETVIAPGNKISAALTLTIPASVAENTYNWNGMLLAVT